MPRRSAGWNIPKAGARRQRLRLAADPATSLARRIGGLAEAMGIWIERVRMRRRLSHLSDHMLRDIGVSRAEAARETEKPFWRK
jgi:uncharacterized protein YjiS (DUF1127 family)